MTDEPRNQFATFAYGRRYLNALTVFRSIL